MSQNNLTEGERKLLTILENAALDNEKCPRNTELITMLNKKTSIDSLALRGYYRIDYYDEYWRVVTILTGPHAGKSTRMPPDFKEGTNPNRSVTTKGDTATIQHHRPQPTNKVSLGKPLPWETDSRG